VIQPSYKDIFTGNRFVAPEPNKEWDLSFLCLWPCWLGEDNIHLLDVVSRKQEQAFLRFMHFTRERWQILYADHGCMKIRPVRSNAVLYTAGLGESFQTKVQWPRTFVLSDLGVVIKESWDYTHLVWSKNEAALREVRPLARRAGLHIFNNEQVNWVSRKAPRPN